MLLDKEMKEINNLETEFRELNDELPLHAQEQAVRQIFEFVNLSCLRFF